MNGFEEFGGQAAQTAKLSGPEGGSQHAAGELVNLLFYKLLPELGGIGTASGVRPSDDGGERIALSVDSNEAVPETGSADSGDGPFCESRCGSSELEGLVEAALEGVEELVRIQFCGAVGFGSEGVGFLGGGLHDALT